MELESSLGGGIRECHIKPQEGLSLGPMLIELYPKLIQLEYSCNIICFIARQIIKQIGNKEKNYDTWKRITESKMGGFDFGVGVKVGVDSFFDQLDSESEQESTFWTAGVRTKVGVRTFPWSRSQSQG